ncbi:MAG: hypothetical protein KGI28_00550 [Thaumarchaeota archaeon]|nr:hypothetical protein [Nitrososphaerota archaeon]
MGLDSDKIRHEIREYLESHGRTRSKKLADEVMKKVGSEKTVYREIKSMYNSGELKKSEKNRADIEYELAQFSETMENNFKILSKQLSDIAQYFLDHEVLIDDKKNPHHYGRKLMLYVQTMKELSKLETRLRIISSFPAFLNRKSVPILQKQIDDIWSKIQNLINQSRNDKLVSELMINFEYIKWVDAIPVIQKD